MFVVFFVSILAVLVSEASGCTFVARNTSINVAKCSYFNYISVAGRHVPLGKHEMRIQPEGPTREVSLYCGRYSDTYSWKYAKKDGNQIRVTFLQGHLHIKVYWCDSFDGPRKAGIHCAIEAFSTACPGRVDHNHTCVYEVVTKRFSGESIRNVVEIETEVAVRVRKFYVSAGVSHTKERTVVKTYSVESRSYVVIPAGYRFCSFSEVISKEDYLAPTGFK